jgi:regulator of sigma D
MTETKNIVSIMIEQHRGLQKELGSVADLLESEKPDSVEIDKSLKQFAKDLAVHLELENNVFYVRLLEKMKAKNQDTAKTEQFIVEMKDIGKAVMAFLEKYKDAESIAEKMEELKPEVRGIVAALNLRVESEESGVYAYWGLF